MVASNTLRTRKSQQRWPGRFHVSHKGTKCRAKGIPFNLDASWADETYTGRCSLTGLEFRPGETNPYSASLDRIDPKLGYVKGNVRWVLNAVNVMRGVGTDEDMYTIAQALLAGVASGTQG